MVVTPLMLHRMARDRESVRRSAADLAEDGRAWIAAEASLVKAHLAQEAKRLALICVLFVVGLVSLGLGFALLVAYVFALLAPLLGGLANAAGALAIVLFAIAALSAWIIVAQIKRTVGLRAVYGRWARMFKHNVTGVYNDNDHAA
jgi:hypothetical protein